MSDSNEDLREELASARAVNAYLFLAVDALARSTFDMFSVLGADPEKRAQLEVEIRENSRKLESALAEARALIWDEESAEKGRE